MDHMLTFNAHIDELCKKAGQKMNALSRLIPYMNITKWRTLLNRLFILQFNYCRIIWIGHSSETNYKLNRFHERCNNLQQEGIYF